MSNRTEQSRGRVGKRTGRGSTASQGSPAMPCAPRSASFRPTSLVARPTLLALCAVLTLCTLLASDRAHAATDPAPDQPLLRTLTAAVDPSELNSTVARLVSFGTRHTLSDTTSDTRGIGAARRWVQSRFEAISRDCGGCLEVVTPSQVFTGTRIPAADRGRRRRRDPARHVGSRSRDRHHWPPRFDALERDGLDDRRARRQ